MTYKRISIILFCADKMYVSARVVPQECSDFMDFICWKVCDMFLNYGRKETRNTILRRISEYQNAYSDNSIKNTYFLPFRQY